MRISFKTILDDRVIIEPEHNERSQVFVTIHAEEVRQYLYCKRILFFRRVMNINGVESRLMHKGTEYHEQRQGYQYKRIGDLHTFRDRYFFHKELNFGGKIDLLRELRDEIIAVEFKRFFHNQKEPFLGHIMQTMIGGLAAQYVMNKPLTEIEIQYYRGSRSLIKVTEQMKERAFGIIEEMKSMITSQILPPPTSHRRKCQNCEFDKVCRQV